uniref:Uncharacterized protein n=1 Tax=Rhizophagus irregularis (strain DAOM 181602 / DAOM 197198 / MUCL 43194) TaxID=747089 RepID=U9SFR1_RHIID
MLHPRPRQTTLEIKNFIQDNLFLRFFAKFKKIKANGYEHNRPIIGGLLFNQEIITKELLEESQNDIYG